ncbi:MAG: hypothetical protein NT091_03750, partial [Candidatus Falkowbacteria bacterium]|nr:hypothetical protein [Candidatus Falkowbacteria bacterium]
WYISAGIISLVLLTYSFFTNNFLFAVLIIIALFIIILHSGEKPIEVKFILSTEGIVLGKKFTNYGDIKDFSVIYQPEHNVRRLYFEFKNTLKHRLSVPLVSENPLLIREILLKYLPENIERETEPLSENLSRFLKI